MWKRVSTWLGPHWVTILVVGTFITLIAMFVTLMTYNPIVERIDVASVLARVSASTSWVFLRGLGLSNVLAP